MSRKLSRFEIESTYDSARDKSDERRWSSYEKKRKKSEKKHQKSTELPIIRFTELGNPVSVWTPDIETSAWKQAEEFASLPFVHPKGLALMPDVHAGRGVCIGSVLPTLGALVPAAAGTDLGCGMIAVKLDLKAHHLPDNLRSLRRLIEMRVPTGNTGTHKALPEDLIGLWKKIDVEYRSAMGQNTQLYRENGWRNLGTLGGGNHFIEVSLDEEKNVWIVIHSGSRGVGAVVGQYFIDKAQRKAKEGGVLLPHLGWFEDKDPLFHEYITALAWAQDFAFRNRQVMLKKVLDCFEVTLGKRPEMVEEAINCHHNYVAFEEHFGQKIWVTRKGAIRANREELGIVPGSMGTETYIVKGKGNTQSYCSCAHGAGRAMSRTQAKQQFTVKDLKNQVAGIECQVSKSRVDEIPAAYKPIKQVMKNQEDLVSVVCVLKQVICIKGD